MYNWKKIERITVSVVKRIFKVVQIHQAVFELCSKLTINPTERL